MKAPWNSLSFQRSTCHQSPHSPVGFFLKFDSIFFAFNISSTSFLTFPCHSTCILYGRWNTGLASHVVVWCCGSGVEHFLVSLFKLWMVLYDSLLLITGSGGSKGMTLGLTSFGSLSSQYFAAIICSGGLSPDFHAIHMKQPWFLSLVRSTDSVCGFI